MTFLQKLEQAIEKNNSLLCVGLDPDTSKFPTHLQNGHESIFAFNKAIIDATHDVVCSFKPQIAYYSALGVPAIEALKKTVDYIRTNYPEIPIILDAKRGDIGPTAQQYAKEAFEFFQVDAVTVNPYLGLDSLQPFLLYDTKGIVILCRTSNESAQDFQDLSVNGTPLYLEVAKKILSWDKEYHNCLMVVGATWPEEIKTLRELAPNMFFLVPGIGVQGGSVQKTLENGLRKDKSGLIITISRSVLYAATGQDFAQKAREKAIALQGEINKYRV